jgi:anti-sigma B factor antagonist
MPAAELAIHQQVTPTGSTIRLSGEIDMSTAGAFRRAVEAVLAESPTRVVLDFGAVTFCDSQGLSTLIALNKAAEAASTSLVLSNVGEFLRRLLDVTGLRPAFSIEDGARPAQ